MELHSIFRRPGLPEALTPLGVLLKSHVFGNDIDGNHGNALLIGWVRAPFVGRRSDDHCIPGRASPPRLGGIPAYLQSSLEDPSAPRPPRIDPGQRINISGTSL